MAKRTDTRSESEKLLEKAIHGTHFRGPDTVTAAELDQLWTMANNALHHGPYHVAAAAVEALLCQADLRNNLCRDMLPEMQPACRGGRSDEMVQGLVDRLESLNWQVQRRKVA